ncbi:MAG: hypothetical protein H7Y01_12435 [Ferruginibacter sp.]|nr:hypothetical protein [Chitinophagaceae bacterium]
MTQENISIIPATSLAGQKIILKIITCFMNFFTGILVGVWVRLIKPGGRL